MDKEQKSMPSPNDYASRGEWEEACWRKILASEKLLKLLITLYERRDLIMRAVTLDRIIAGKSYNEIVRELQISPQTVSGIKKSLLTDNKYKSYVKQSKGGKRNSVRNLRQMQKKRFYGISRRTKYGTIRIP